MTEIPEHLKRRAEEAMRKAVVREQSDRPYMQGEIRPTQQIQKQQPKPIAAIGRIVHYHAPTHKFVHNEQDHTFDLVEDTSKIGAWRAINNGSDIAPAMIVRAWNETYVNIRIFVDGHDLPWKTSVNLITGTPTPNDFVNGYCTWPERV